MNNRDSQQPIGRVFLVGAGPGNPGLLTLRGRECIESADAILHDSLANSSILQYASADCSIESVGKSGNNKEHSWSQFDINNRMVELAKQGLDVVRLKGGDPAVFARTAEEIDCLVRENIEFEIVPGITAALAASSYAGIPITHRDWASAAAVITGHSLAIDGGSEADEPFDWQSLAQFPGTIIVYMGVRTAEHWTRKLLAAGKPGTTPVALIRNVSLPSQRSFYCQLDAVSETLETTGLSAPLIAIVGPVVGLGRRYNWFEALPLHNKTILLTRPDSRVGPWRQVLSDLGADVLSHPLIKIQRLTDTSQFDAAVKDLRNKTWCLFTSQHAVEQFFDCLSRNQSDVRMIGNCKIATVGPATASRFASRSVSVDLTLSSNCSAKQLAEQVHFATDLENNRPSSAAVFKASRGESDACDALIQHGFQCDEIVAYQHIDVEQANPVTLAQLSRGKIDWLIVTSPLSAENCARLFGSALLKTKILAFSPQIASKLTELGYPPAATTEETALESVIESICAFDTTTEA